jgi:hypothetical protein
MYLFILHSLCWSYFARRQTKIRRSFPHHVRGWPGQSVSVNECAVGLLCRECGVRGVWVMYETSPSSSTVQYPSFTGTQESFDHLVFSEHFTACLRWVRSALAVQLLEHSENHYVKIMIKFLVVVNSCVLSQIFSFPINWMSTLVC